MKAVIKFLLGIFPRTFLIKMSLILRKPISLLYYGNKVECPVCGKTFRKFMPYGYSSGIRDDRLCPGCLSLERHRLLWLYLKNRTTLLSELNTFLHIAPEQPFLKRFKSLKNINYITADLESPIAEVKVDIRDMNIFTDNKFDVIICNHVLEHIDNEEAALKELYRILKPGGWSILQVPIDYERDETYEDNSITDKKQREQLFGQYDHVRVYGKDYPLRLRKIGFEVIEDDYIKSFSDKEIERYKLDKAEIIYLCKKLLN